ncbi:Lipaseclass 3 [Penicillium lividum]|nr:Lipaseclass 3 [Penicillium lividum]
MASPQVHHLFHAPIADHSFSSDRQTLAVARENNVELYQTSGNKFELSDELKGHEKTVTSVDIAPNSGRIVTCSQDRNAYVWEKTPSGWKPTLVLLRINRAATFVRWSPSEQKFAVGSGARVIAVCYFEEENDWWISKHLKKPIRSTITTLAWHPNSVLLAAGSTDSHARVFSSFIKGIDNRPEPSAWGERLPFNTICGEYLNDSAGWIQGVAFSPSGNALAFTGHDSSVTVVYPSAPEQPPRAMLNISTRLLPLNSLIWNGENEILAAGHDCEPFRFKGDENGWQLAGSLEKQTGAGAGPREESALNMFRQMDLKGQSQVDTKLKSTHQNTVNTLRAYDEADGQLSDARRNFPDYEITLVGHSLGGAVAALAGLEMKLKGWNPSVTTFGEPMVGNQEFVEFLDEQFHMGSDRVTRSFRRVTHINDPIPLLPLKEWGYAAHAGEIFISKLDLPPSIEDLQICQGDQDPQCIAGSDASALLLDMYQDTRIPLDVFSTRPDPCSSHMGQGGTESGHQVVLGMQRDLVGLDCASDDATAPLYPRRWDWSLIPARYRLWELFYAHRDYFWRIGLCVPGGTRPDNT